MKGVGGDRRKSSLGKIDVDHSEKNRQETEGEGGRPVYRPDVGPDGFRITPAVGTVSKALGGGYKPRFGVKEVCGLST